MNALLQNKPLVYPTYAEYAVRWTLVLLAAIVLYFLCRWAIRHSKQIVTYSLVRLMIGWKATSQFSRELGRQVRSDVTEHTEQRAKPEQKRIELGRLAVAGRFFFNVAIAPLLLSFVVIGVIWVAGLIAG